MGIRMKKAPHIKWKTGKRETIEGIKLSNQESVRTLNENKNYKYLEIFDTDTIKQVETK